MFTSSDTPSAAAALRLAARDFTAQLPWFYHGLAFERWQRHDIFSFEANALDFDDLIMTTVHLLQAFPDVAEAYRRRSDDFCSHGQRVASDGAS